MEKSNQPSKSWMSLTKSGVLMANMKLHTNNQSLVTNLYLMPSPVSVRVDKSDSIPTKVGNQCLVVELEALEF